MQPNENLDAVAKLEHETWERCATSYMNGFGSLVCQSIPSLLDAADVADGSRVLDVGCGPGLVSAAIQDRNATAIGIDYSEAMIRQARRSLPDIDFHVGSADALPFSATEFDAAVANFVYHHLAYPDKALSEAHRVLKDGGKTAFTIWVDRERLAGFGLFFEALEQHIDLGDMPFGPLHGVTDFAVLNAMMCDAGFCETEIREIHIDWRIPSLDDYLSAFHAWGNLDALPDAVGNAIESHVRKKAESLVNEGNLTLANPAILVSGTKRS